MCHARLWQDVVLGARVSRIPVRVQRLRKIQFSLLPVVVAARWMTTRMRRGVITTIPRDAGHADMVCGRVASVTQS
jgi:hypothetical protein